MGVGDKGAAVFFFFFWQKGAPEFEFSKMSFTHIYTLVLNQSMISIEKIQQLPLLKLKIVG